MRPCSRISFALLLATALLSIQVPANTLYLDCSAATNGDGTEAAPFNSLGAAIAAAAAGDTVRARGALLVSDVSQCVVIPESKSELTLTGWGDDRLAIEVADNFITNGGGGTNVISVFAVSNTISGIDFTYHKNSLGIQNKGQAKFVLFHKEYGTLRDCSFFKPANEKPGYQGAYTIVGSAGSNAGHLTIEKCHFENIFGVRGDCNRDAISASNHTTVRWCVFTNCWGMLSQSWNGLFKDYLVVSNIIYLAKADDSGYISKSGTSVGFFWSGYPGMGSGEIAYNVIVGSDRSQSVFGYRTWQGFRGSTVTFHHNTVVGLASLVAGGNNNQNGANAMTLHAFDNVLDVDVLFFENSSVAGSGKKVSHIKDGSFFKNNAYHLVDESVIADGAATESDEYNLLEMLDFSDNYPLASPPSFISTVLASPGYFVPKQRDNPTWATKKRALTSYGGVAYPDFIGARKYRPIPGARMELR